MDAACGSENGVAKEGSGRKLSGNDPVSHTRNPGILFTQRSFDAVKTFDVSMFSVLYRAVSLCMYFDVSKHTPTI